MFQQNSCSIFVWRGKTTCYYYGFPGTLDNLRKSIDASNVEAAKKIYAVS
jgi:hypothetical protein